MENTKKAVVAHDLVGDEMGNLKPHGPSKGVEIPDELQRTRKVEKDNDKDEI